MGQDVRTLLARGDLEFDYEFGRYPAAVFDVDALGLGPVADFGGVQGVRLSFASAAGWPVPCQNSHMVPELVFPLLVSLLSGTR